MLAEFLVVKVLVALINILSFLIILRVVLSWLMVFPTNILLQYLFDVTDFFLKPVQKIIPPLGMIDFSPFIILIFLQFLKQFIFNYV